MEYHPSTLFLLQRAGVRCAVFAALLIFFYLLGWWISYRRWATRFRTNRIALNIDLQRRSRCPIRTIAVTSSPIKTQ